MKIISDGADEETSYGSYDSALASLFLPITLFASFSCTINK
jgi:hypothetical protein